MNLLNREIKFRFYCEDSDTLSRAFTIEELVNGTYDWHGDIHKSVKNQCTGLKDKNDVEIYEGDIVRYTTCTKDKYTFNLEVLYEEELARFHARGRYSNSSVIFSLTCDSVLDAEIKVIGNIYENKDLLNKI